MTQILGGLLSKRDCGYQRFKAGSGKSRPIHETDQSSFRDVEKHTCWHRFYSVFVSRLSRNLWYRAPFLLRFDLATAKVLSRRWKMLADMKLNGTFEISAVTVENPNCAHSNFSYFWYLVKRAPYRTPYIFPALTTLLNLQVLKWAVENGCPWDKRVRDFMPGGACGFMALHQVRNIRDTLSEIAMYLIFRRSTHVCIPGVWSDQIRFDAARWIDRRRLLSILFYSPTADFGEYCKLLCVCPIHNRKGLPKRISKSLHVYVHIGVV